MTSFVKANPRQERELINISDQTPFDCRANHKTGRIFERIGFVKRSFVWYSYYTRRVEKNGSSRAEFFTNEDRRAMGIRIPIHLVFLEEKENVIEISEEKLKTYMSEVSKKKLGRIVKIIKMISENPYISIDEMKT